MLIPISEIQNNSDHYKFKAAYDLALEYQLEKVLYFSKEVERGLDQQANHMPWCISDKRFSYDLDALIHNLSILTEYYHSWVVFSYIGTTAHEKTKYVPLKNDQERDAKIDKIFKANSIGVLKISQNYRGDFYKDCKKSFIQAYEFLFVGKFYEVYVLNNYIKHNIVAMSYSPKVIFGDRQMSFPFLYIDKPFDRLLNSSVLKWLIDCNLDINGKVIGSNDDYFVDIINTTGHSLGKIGSYNIYHINGIDYLKSDAIVGISIESIVEMAHELVLNIVEFFMNEAKGIFPSEEKLRRLVNEIKMRSPKTINKLLNIS